MKVIGITGPTGAGKTTALGALEELGAVVIDCDAVYHRLLAESAPLRAALTGRFGPGILGLDGGVDRKKLGNVVFNDPAALADLNAITHRFVMEEVDRAIARAEAEGRPPLPSTPSPSSRAVRGSGVTPWWPCWPPRRCATAASWPGGHSGGLRPPPGGGPEGGRVLPRHCPYVLENRGEESREDFARRARELFARILAGSVDRSQFHAMLEILQHQRRKPPWKKSKDTWRTAPGGAALSAEKRL